MNSHPKTPYLPTRFGFYSERRTNIAYNVHAVLGRYSLADAYTFWGRRNFTSCSLCDLAESLCAERAFALVQLVQFEN